MQAPPNLLPEFIKIVHQQNIIQIHIQLNRINMLVLHLLDLLIHLVLKLIILSQLQRLHQILLKHGEQLDTKKEVGL